VKKLEGNKSMVAIPLEEEKHIIYVGKVMTVGKLMQETISSVVHPRFL
jgi:hypothetical protein